MKKIWSICLALSLTVTLFGCKKAEEKGNSPIENNATTLGQSTETKPQNQSVVSDYLKEDAVIEAPDSSIITDVKPPQKVERGNQIGDYCANASLEILDEDGDTGAFIMPAATGRPAVIYFWGTWNTPGVEGLVHLDRMAAELGEDVAIIAVHTPLQKETLSQFIAVEYPDSNVIFTADSGEDMYGDYYAALGGQDVYPYTVILNPKGQIVDILVTDITYDMMRDALDLAYE